MSHPVTKEEERTAPTPQEFAAMEVPEVERLWQEALGPAQRAEQAHIAAKKQAARYRRHGASVPEYLQERIQAAYEEMQTALESTEAFRTEWTRRGGWSRFYLVPGGHIHFMGCGTITPGLTWIGLVWEASGMTAQEVVERFSYTACTHCFPEAPVEKKVTPEEEGFCKLSGEPLTEESMTQLERRWGEGWRSYAVSRSTRCPECGGYPSVTQAAKYRKHKPGKPEL